MLTSVPQKNNLLSRSTAIWIVWLFLLSGPTYAQINRIQSGQLEKTPSGPATISGRVRQGSEPGQNAFFDENEAKSILRSLSNAAELFAQVNSGRYPQSMEELTEGNPPYITHDYCGRILSGFRFECQFSPRGYEFTAVALNPEAPTWVIATRGIMYEKFPGEGYVY